MTGIFNVLMGSSGAVFDDIVFVGAKTADGGAITGSAANLTISMTDLTGGVASAPADDDIVVVSYTRCSTGQGNTDLNVNEFNELVDIFSDDTYETNLCVAWKKMPYPPDTSVVITRPATGVYAALIQVFRNCDPNNTIDTTTTTATAINGGQPDPPSIDTTSKGVVVGIGSTASVTSGTTSFTSSDLDNFRSTIRNGATSGATIGGGSKLSDGGVFDPAQFGGGTSNTEAAWAAATLALRARIKPKYKIIEQVGTATYAVNSDTIILPSGLQEGDLVIICSCAGTASQNLPAGYTNGQNAGSSDSAAYRWSYKFMGSTPDTTATGLTTSASVHMAFAFRNVDQTIPLDAPSPTVSYVSSSGMPNPPAINTRTDGAVVIGLGFLDDDNVASSITAPSGYTLIGSDDNTGGSPGSTLMAAFLTATTADSYDPGIFGGTGSDSNNGATLALRPALEA